MSFDKDKYSIEEVRYYVGDPYHPQGLYARIKMPCGRASYTCIYTCGEEEAKDINNGVIKKRSDYGEHWGLLEDD